LAAQRAVEGAVRNDSHLDETTTKRHGGAWRRVKVVDESPRLKPAFGYEYLPDPGH
jgi:hypothetical protein